MKTAFNILFCLVISNLRAQDAADHIKAGNQLYKERKWENAIEVYSRVNTGPHQYIAAMNTGNARYRLKAYDAAVKSYRQASAASNPDRVLRSGAYYNTGVVYSAQEKLEESIEAYKQALRLNSNDTRARENLQKALLARKQQQGGGGEDQQQNQQQNKAPQKSNANNEQAQKQLNKLEEKEKNTQQRISESKSQYGISNEKDW